MRDGLRAVKNALEDKCVVPGAGAYEVAVNLAIKKGIEKIKGKSRLGMQAYGEGMLVIPKVLAQNAGYDPQDVMVTLVQEAGDGSGKVKLTGHFLEYGFYIPYNNFSYIIPKKKLQVVIYYSLEILGSCWC